MATLKTRWLLSILLVNLPNSFALTVPPGPPAPPSRPDCHIPCGEKNCLVDIYCNLRPKEEPQVPTNYTLHWMPEYSEGKKAINGTSLDGRIPREHFNHGELCIWIQATNQYGSTESEEVKFNTEDIIKPPVPNVIIDKLHEEIDVKSFCDDLRFSVGQCYIRSRKEADQVWPEDEDEFHTVHTFENLQPCTAYEFQVRCNCARGLMSDWTKIDRIQGAEQAPVGELDLWWDCGISPASSDCVLIWKRLPVSQECGLILGYEVQLSYSNGRAVLVNLTTAEPTDQLVCDETQCRLSTTVKDASSVSVSAYNAHGASEPSFLTMPVTGKEQNEQALELKMTEDSLTASWDLPYQLLDNLKEYVVQYKQAGSPAGQGLDWIKVNKSHTSASMTGQFKNHTPYQVSLFTVSLSNDVRRLSSVVGYSLEGTPASVPSLKVSAMAATHVTLLWEPVPLLKQKGVILYYQIGVDRQNDHEIKYEMDYHEMLYRRSYFGGPLDLFSRTPPVVYNVNASSQDGTMSLKLQDLSPDHEYEVWIRAVTAAGPGNNATIRFQTKQDQDFTYLAVLFGISCPLLLCAVLVFVSAFRENKSCPLLPQGYCEKVPDPRNSRIFREMKHQINDPMAWVCIPVSEPHPKISLLEVLETQPRAVESSPEESTDTDGLITPAVEEGSSQTDRRDVPEECHKPDHKYGRQAYSKMVDSDEERDGGEEEGDCLSSSEEEQCPSGYEKHFMPTALEILEVS